MNVALRLLMSGAAGPQNRLVRVKAVAESVTATFDEGTPLDSTHLLVACSTNISGGTPSTPSGWTRTEFVSVSSGNFCGIFVRQANSSVNSITISAATSGSSLTLMAFSGFVSATAVTKGVFDRNANATSQAVSIPDTAGVYGIAVAVLGLSNDPTSWGNWSGTELVRVAVPDPAGSGTVARGEYIPGSGSLDSTVTWAGSFIEPGYVWAVFQLTPP